MKKIAIYFFSGTGNTKIIAELAAEEFRRTGNEVSLIRIETLLKNAGNPDVSGFDLIGISNPVIGFGSPDIVFQFIRKMPHGNGKKVFLLKTAGGVGPINYPSSRPVIRMLKRKGYDVFYDRLFSIGSNWVVKFDDKITHCLYDASQKKVKSACIEIIEGKRRTQNSGIIVTLLMETIMVIDHFFVRFIGLDLHVTNACNHCGQCAMNCPVGNVVDKKGKFHFGIKCNCCMRCVYACPRNAIRFRIFSFFVVPGGYSIDKIIKTTRCTSELTGIRKPPFFDKYLNNDNI